MAEPNTFGARLTELREKAKLTKYRLAQISGVSAQTLSQLENGNGDPSWDTVKRLARALNLPISEFDTGDDPRKEDESPQPDDADKPVQVIPAPKKPKSTKKPKK